MGKYIIYFGHFELPDKNALAHRVQANARMFESLGYKVILVGYNKNTREKYHKHNDYWYEVRYPQNLKDWISDFESYKLIDEIIQKNGASNCDAIIATGVGAGNTLGLIRLSKKHHISFISDLVDWVMYSKRRPIYNLIKFIYDYLLCSLIIQKAVNNHIYISSHLKAKYKSSRRNTVVIPSLTYKSDPRFSGLTGYRSQETIKMCYAGNPGRRGSKDRLDWCVMAFNENDSVDASLDIYGMDMSTFIEEYPNIPVNNARIVFHGRCSNTECLNSISVSDYFVFAREKSEVTESGFPTKFSEALAVGTPVITTPTSDLRRYLENGKNGFISSECSYKSFSLAMKEALSMNKNQRESMHNNPSPLDETYWREELWHFLKEMKC